MGANFLGLPDCQGCLSVLQGGTFCITEIGMKTLVLRLSDELEIQLQALALQRNKTKSALAREVLWRGVRSRRKGQSLSTFDLMRDNIGIVNAGVGDLASNPGHMKDFGH